MNQEEKYIGYLKYSGKSIEDGLLDARKSAEALLGFDEILRYFVTKKNPEFKNINFEIPVRIRKGSWEALIPEIIEKWYLIPIIIYAKGMANKASQDGLFETGAAKDIKKTIKIAMKGIQWMIKIASHIKTLNNKKLENIKINKEIIKIPNAKGKYLNVPEEYYNIFIHFPKKLFVKIASIIEEERELEIGTFKEGKEEIDEKITIPFREKKIFYSKEYEDTEEILFPELEHNQNVELKGKIMRGDEKANSLGFEYKGHILTCRPMEKRSIATYKEKIVSQQEEHIFQKVKITGKINRLDRNGEFKKYPTIIFSNIIQVEKPPEQATLF